MIAKCVRHPGLSRFQAPAITLPDPHPVSLVAGIKHKWETAYITGATASSCGGGGCNLEQYAQTVASNFMDESNVQGPIDSTVDRSGFTSPMTASDAFPNVFLPGIRFGTYQAPAYSAGYVEARPKATTAASITDKYIGSWLIYDRRFCNPLGWLSSSKSVITPAGDRPGSQAGAVFNKLTLCLKANCASDDAACPPRKCYVKKHGKCVRFNTDVFPKYASAANRTHSRAAAELLASGAYTACNEEEQLAFIAVVSGN